VAAGVLVAGLVLVSSGAGPAEAAGAAWYVAPTGSDANSCAAPASPCATPNGAIGKASAGDTIEVATGTYTGSGGEVVLVGKSVTLAGGWNPSFTTQDGVSTIDGQTARRGVRVAGASVGIERFTVENGDTTGQLDPQGAGVSVDGVGAALVLDRSTVKDSGPSGGIWSDEPLTITNSTVSGNRTNLSSTAGGVTVYGPPRNAPLLTITNSTVSGNSANGAGGGVAVWDGAVAQLSNVTITANTAAGGGGGGIVGLAAEWSSCATASSPATTLTSPAARMSTPPGR